MLSVFLLLQCSLRPFEPAIARGRTSVGTCCSGEKDSTLGGVEGSGDPSGEDEVCEAGLSVSRCLLLLVGGGGGSGRSPANASSDMISLWIQRSTSRLFLENRGQLTPLELHLHSANLTRC